MCTLFFPSKIWAKKCTLYTGKYSNKAQSQADCFFPFYSSFSKCFNFFGSFALPYKFRIMLSVSKTLAGIVIEIILNLYINLRTIDIFTMLSLWVHEQDMILHLFRSSLIFFMSILYFSAYKSCACFILKGKRFVRSEEKLKYTCFIVESHLSI